jgi:HK97 family phage major capsid protein
MTPDEMKAALADEFRKIVVPMRTEIDGIKGAVDGLDQEKFNRMADQATKAAEAIQQLEAKQRALEVAMARPNQGEAKDDALAKHQSAFVNYLRSGEVKGFKCGADGVEVRTLDAKAMQTNVGPDGGFLVRPDLAPFQVTRVFETSPLRQVARVVSMSTRDLDVIIDDNEAGARWVNEGPSGGETTTPQLGRKTLIAHKIEADPRVTHEMIEDAIFDIESWLGSQVADRFARAENTAFFTGDGVDKPKGLLTYANWASPGVYQRDRVEQFISGSATVMTADALIQMKAGLKEFYQPSAVWLMKRATYGTILTLKGADQYHFAQTLLRDGQSVDVLLGKRVIMCDDMQATGTATNLIIAYGDFGRGYTIGDRVGMQVLRDPFTNKGFVTYYCYKRTAGDVTNFDSFKLMRVAAP